MAEQGTATNTRGEPLDSVYWSVVHYDGAGRFINAGTALGTFYGSEVPPGESRPFEVEVDSGEPVCFGSARVLAAGS